MRIAISVTFALVLGASGCAPPAATPPRVVRYAFKNFTESRLMAEMYSLLLQAGQYQTAHGGALNSSETRNGLLNNDLDIYPEYTGTGLEVHLGVTDKSITTSPDNIVAVRERDLTTNRIVWGAAADLNNSYVIAVTRSDGARAGLAVLSDLARYSNTHPHDFKWLVNKEFYERPDGLAGMRDAYGMSITDADIVRVNETDASGSVFDYYQAVKDDGNHYALIAYATDSQLFALDLATLDDDARFFPYYAPAATVRKEFLDRNPDILTRVNPIAPLLNNAVMMELNHEVDYGGRTPTDVAHDFLVRNGLLP